MYSGALTRNYPIIFNLVPGAKDIRFYFYFYFILSDLEMYTFERKYHKRKIILDV